MTTIDSYIQLVLRNIQASPEECRKLEQDLRAHLQEAIAAGEPAEQAFTRMGSPEEVAAAFMEQRSFKYAGFWRRSLAFMVDLALLMILCSLLVLLAIPFSNLVPQHPVGIGYVVGGLAILVVISCILAAVGLAVLYFPILEGRFGQTLGKHWLRLRVLQENGLPIHYKQAFLRRLSYYTEFLLFDGLFIPFTSKKQRAMDIVARTIVIVE